DSHVHVTMGAGYDLIGVTGFGEVITCEGKQGALDFIADYIRKHPGEERGKLLYRCKSVWDSGALVAWSSDTIVYADFSAWNPYLGMEIGMTRKITKKSKAPEMEMVDYIFPPEDERMGIEEMLLGYTINGAKQLGIEKTKGSIEAGKDADFLVFGTDLLTAEHEGFSHNKPETVYFAGRKVN
ncbi:MAG: amidohydrolase family protein, partial [Clostridia bacterium]|nr:amidohydrolase family protein [Clostridia bacterium]